MRSHFWRSTLIACLIQGLATAISPYLGMMVGAGIGFYVVSRLVLIARAAVWWYDLSVVAVLISIALVSTSMFAGICLGLPFTGITTRACRAMSFGRAALLNLWTIALIGGAIWIAFRLWLWRKLR